MQLSTFQNFPGVNKTNITIECFSKTLLTNMQRRYFCSQKYVRKIQCGFLALL